MKTTDPVTLLPQYTRRLYELLLVKQELTFSPMCESGKRSVDVQCLVNNGLAQIVGDSLVLLDHQKNVQFENE